MTETTENGLSAEQSAEAVRLTSEGYDALSRNDHNGAEATFETRAALFDRALDGGETAAEPGERGVLEAPGEQRLTAAEVDARFAEMGDPQRAALLRKEWGADAADNLAFATGEAATFIRGLAQSAPSVAQEVLDFIEESGLGDDPALIKAFAQLGRRNTSSGAGRAGQTPSQRRLVEPAGPADSGGEAQMRRITSEIHDAHARNDRREVERLSTAREVLASRLYGDEPITGRGQRNL